MSEEPTGVSPTAGRLAKYPKGVVFTTLVLAAILTTGCFVFDLDSINIISVVGLLATVWALILAAVIYLLTAEDTDKIVSKIEDLTEQIAELAPDVAPQSPPELTAALEDYTDYVKHLCDELNIPVQDIISVTKPGEGRGNRPVIIETRLNRRYSVYKGGRGKTGFTVTKLDRPELETVR